MLPLHDDALIKVVKYAIEKAKPTTRFYKSTLVPSNDARGSAVCLNRLTCPTHGEKLGKTSLQKGTLFHFV